MDITILEHLLDIGETQNIEFKGNVAFEDDFRAHIASSIISFANTSGGGRIILGISNNDNKIIGVSANNIPSFDPTKISNYLKERTSILPTYNITRLEFKSKIILIINVKEFDDLPIIITKQISTNKKVYANPGDILIRSKGCECRRIHSYEEMQDLITRSIMKRSELLLSQIKTIISGEEPKEPQIDPKILFKKRLPNWDNMLEKLNIRLKDAAHWEFQILPLSSSNILEMQQIPELIRKTSVRWRGWSLPQDFDQYNNGRYFTNYAEVSIETKHPYFRHEDFWQMSNTGAFGQAKGVWQDLVPQQPSFDYPPPPNRLISYKDICWSILEYFRFATNIVEALDIDELWMRIALVNINERTLGEYNNLVFSVIEPKKSFSPYFELSSIFSKTQLISSWEQIAYEWTKQAFTIFQWPHVQRDFIEKLHEELKNI